MSKNPFFDGVAEDTMFYKFSSREEQKEAVNQIMKNVNNLPPLDDGTKFYCEYESDSG